MDDAPADPEDWSHEEWLAWLAEGDAVLAGEAVGDAALDAPLADDDDGDSAADGDAGGGAGAEGRPGLTGGLGARMLAASMRGLNDAIYGPKDEPAIVIEAAGDPPDPEGLDVHLDPDHPEQSVVVVRPWLLRRLHDERSGDPPDR